MEFDKFYTIDFNKTNEENNQLFDHIRQRLINDGCIKIKCENIGNDINQYDKICLNLIESIGGIGCPYGKDPQGLVWSVKVLALDSDPQAIDLPGTNVDRELHFHTDCSYEENAPDYIGLFIVQCDRSEHGGKFQLVKTNEIIDKLSQKTKEILTNEKYKIIVRPAYRKNKNDSIYVPIILSNQRMRYQPDLIDKYQLINESIEKQNAIEELNSILFNHDQLHIIRPMLENGMIILFNNHRFLHGRTKILDLDRHLLRIRFNLVHR